MLDQITFMKILILLLIFTDLLVSLTSSGQNCVQPQTVIGSASTTQLSGGITGFNPFLEIKRTSDASIRISDFSGGFFDHFGYGFDHPVELNMDCSGAINSTRLMTDFGECLIEGGLWNEDNQQLTLEWSLPFNKIKEVTLINF
jgi:hypothetical protein